MASANPATPAPTRLSPQEIRSIIIGLMLAILLGALDSTIISVALPKMAADLQGINLLAWVMSGYLIAMAVATPIYGKLGDIYGRRSVLSSAIILFLAASVACAMAPTMPVLVAARILQGLGGGGLISVAQATIADVVSPRDRGRYQAYISGAFAVASVSGPVLGGLLTAYLSWRWVFWINLPLGLIALLISRRALAKLQVPQRKRSVDYLGAILLSAGLTAILLAITRAGQQNVPGLDHNSLWMAGLAIVSLAAFGWHALHAAEPIVPLGLFRIRTVTLCCLILFIAFVELVALTVLVPLELQMLTSMGADGAAWRLIPLSLGVPMGAYTSGRLMTHWGTYKGIQLTGTLLTPIAIFLIAFANPTATVIMTILLSLVGFGIGLQLPSSTVAVQNSVPHHHVGVATAASAFCRSLGSAIGIALLTAFLLSWLRTGADGLGNGMSGAEIINTLIGHSHASLQDMDLSGLAPVAQQSFEKVYMLAAALATPSIFLTLLLKNEPLSEKAPEPASKL
ncbi:MDR family MFS transporter [Pollutimonas harenae]|uniref:MFS transporter n=1 Tax=Pollutimonas harenae TaxID=657015 RepID=A0A853H1U6_9BURK|nr:MDR family MFS transporter [Pollutimonas harenae]NYT86926.1 MFS transporter [Pollutimonas harenae]TEA69362.1 MFS transporter [Pollutimonas harenae]